MSRKLSCAERSRAYKWVTALRSHAPEQFGRILNHGTPSPELVEYDRLGCQYGDGVFPLSLAMIHGQRLLYVTAQKVQTHVQTMPLLAWLTLRSVTGMAEVRRTRDARRNALLVAEAVLHRVATEGTPNVLCALWTIREWIGRAYDVWLSPNTVQAALQFWDQLPGSPIRVERWGERSGEQLPTQVTVVLPDHPEPRSPRSPVVPPGTIGGSGSGIDSHEQTEAAAWVAQHAHAMESVHLLQGVERKASAERRAERSRALKAQHAEERRERTDRITKYIASGGLDLAGPESVEEVEAGTTIDQRPEEIHVEHHVAVQPGAARTQEPRQADRLPQVDQGRVQRRRHDQVADVLPGL